MKHLTATHPYARRFLPAFGIFTAFLLVLLFARSSATYAQAGPAAHNHSTAAEADGAANPKSYTESLKELSALYEQDAQKLGLENEKLKKLYADGIIARIELEKNDKALADARTRVDATQKQIAEATAPPPFAVATGTADIATNVAWSTGNVSIDNMIRHNGTQHGVDPYLIFCLMNQESGFASRVVSPKGAQGLMQLMPGTAARYGVTNPFDVSQNISAGTRYLKDLLEMFNGRLDLALAGYNAGEGAIIKYGYQIPPYSETRNYVRLITMRYGMKGVAAKKA